MKNSNRLCLGISSASRHLYGSSKAMFSPFFPGGMWDICPLCFVVDPEMNYGLLTPPTYQGKKDNDLSPDICWDAHNGFCNQHQISQSILDCDIKWNEIILLSAKTFQSRMAWFHSFYFLLFSHFKWEWDYSHVCVVFDCFLFLSH